MVDMVAFNEQIEMFSRISTIFQIILSTPTHGILSRNQKSPLTRQSHFTINTARIRPRTNTFEQTVFVLLFIYIQ